MMVRLRRLLEMIRFSHTLFALPFALLASVMAWVAPRPDGQLMRFRWQDLLGILICMVAARSAAMSFNRLVDRDVDAANPRTATRHLPAGLLTTRGVIGFTVVCGLVFQGATVLFLPNIWPLVLALPVLAVLLLYSLTKRFTMMSHFWLGLSLMLAPVCAWIALRGEVLLAHPDDLLLPVLLGLAVLVWVAGFDMIYACQDADFDRQAKLHSIPARLGIRGALRLAAACHVLTVLVLVSLPWLFPTLGLGFLYLGALAGVAMLLSYEHAIVRPDDLTRVNVAFFNVNILVSVGLLVVGSLDLLWI